MAYLSISQHSIEFESEFHLELFVCESLLEALSLKLLARQHPCQAGICDVLAIGPDRQLVILELKNTVDSHVLEQITAYFDALSLEQPFSDLVDYHRPIDLYTLCPDYVSRTPLILKYHKLDFRVLCYKILGNSNNFLFYLYDWLAQQELLCLSIPVTQTHNQAFALPSAPQSFINLLKKLQPDSQPLLEQIRLYLYETAYIHSLKLDEVVDGKAIRFQRTKRYPIAEVGWDTKREQLDLYLWLPFSTGIRYPPIRRTNMMKIWLQDDQVQFIGYLPKNHKGCKVITEDEINNGQFTAPAQSRKHRRPGSGYYATAYWKGIAMPVAEYLEILKEIDIHQDLGSIQSFLSLAIETALQRSQT